jgi:hypothetical protein
MGNKNFVLRKVLLECYNYKNCGGFTMQTDYTKNLEQVIRQELLPTYLKYNREHTIETSPKVNELIETLAVRREQQVPALFKPPKK